MKKYNKNQHPSLSGNDSSPLCPVSTLICTWRKLRGRSWLLKVQLLRAQTVHGHFRPYSTICKIVESKNFFERIRLKRELSWSGLYNFIFACDIWIILWIITTMHTKKGQFPTVKIKISYPIHEGPTYVIFSVKVWLTIFLTKMVTMRS